MFQFDGISDFLAMGGHGPYVWLSYGITVAVMFYLVVAPILRRRQVLDQVRRLNRGEWRTADRESRSERDIEAVTPGEVARSRGGDS